MAFLKNNSPTFKPPGGGGELGTSLGMCASKEYGFSAVLVINKVWFLYSSPNVGMFLRISHFNFHHYQKENQEKPFTNYVYGNLTLV